MQATHRVIVNTGILYLRMGVTVFMSLYTTRLILSSLGTEDFGLFNLVGGIITMLTFLSAAMSSATQRFMSFSQGAGDPENVERIFNMSIILHIGCSILILLLMESMTYFLFNGFLNIAHERIAVANTLYQFMILSTIITILGVPYEAVITSHENMLFYAFLGILESSLKLAIAFYIALGTFHLPSRFYFIKECNVDVNVDSITNFINSFYQMKNCFHIEFNTYDNLIIYGFLISAIPLLLLLIRIIYCHKKYSECTINIKKNYDKNLIKNMTAFMGWDFLSTASVMTANYGQSIVLNIFYGTAVNAAQGIASQLSGILAALSSTLMKALVPMITKSEGAGNRSLMLNASMTGSKISFFIMMLMHIPFLIDSSFILKLWLKNIPDYTIIFCKLLLIRDLSEQLTMTMRFAIIAEGNIKYYSIAKFFLSLLPLPISYLLFSLSFPAYTIYIVFLVYSIIYSIVILYYAKNNCQLSILNYFNNVLLRCVPVFLIVFILSYIPYKFMEPSLYRLSLIVSVAFFSNVASIYIIGFTESERIKVKQLLYSVLKRLKQENASF